MRTNGPSAAGNAVTLRVIGGQTAIATGHTYPAPPDAGVHTYYERMPIGAGQTIGIQPSTTGDRSSFRRTPPSAGLQAMDPAVPRWPDQGPDRHGLDQCPLPGDARARRRRRRVRRRESGWLPGRERPAERLPAPGRPTRDAGAAADAGTGIGARDQIDSGPAKKITKSKTSFTFGSPSAGATFECALDRGGFSDSASPKKLKKLANGKHRFRVRALSAAGLIDRSPAEQSFSVKLPK